MIKSNPTRLQEKGLKDPVAMDSWARSTTSQAVRDGSGLGGTIWQGRGKLDCHSLRPKFCTRKLCVQGSTRRNHGSLSTLQFTFEMSEHNLAYQPGGVLLRTKYPRRTHDENVTLDENVTHKVCCATRFPILVSKKTIKLAMAVHQTFFWIRNVQIFGFLKQFLTIKSRRTRQKVTNSEKLTQPRRKILKKIDDRA